MAPTKNEKTDFKCREVTYNKTFTFCQNKLEKKSNHLSVTRRSSTLLLMYNADTKIYHCLKSGCSKYKRSTLFL